MFFAIIFTKTGIHILMKTWRICVERFYQSFLRDNHSILSRTKGMMPYMIEHNWLVSYQTIEGINQFNSNG
jgi:hypothetical protein